MKKTILFILATGALLCLVWEEYIDPLLQVGILWVQNEQVLNATRLQHKIDVYDPNGDMGEDFED